MNKIQLMTVSLLSVLISGCATCKDRIVDSVQQGDYIAAVGFRECGSYSGLNVSIYHVDDGPLKAGEGSKEPFKAVVRSSEPYVFDVCPVSADWLGDKQLLVRHDTRTGMDDSPAKLMVIRADAAYKDISIEYVPVPVIWE